MPRHIKAETRWKPFRRWLIERLNALEPEQFVIVEAPDDSGYVQFVHAPRIGLIGECCDPRMVERLQPRAQLLDQHIVALGWNPIDPSSGSPNYSATWSLDPQATTGAFDLSDAVDAVDLAVTTLRIVLGARDPRMLVVLNDQGESEDWQINKSVSTKTNGRQAPSRQTDRRRRGEKDLATFLLARISEEQEALPLAAPGVWSAVPVNKRVDGWNVKSQDWRGDPLDVAVDHSSQHQRGACTWATAEHIARWDPRRATHELSLKRVIVQEATAALANASQLSTAAEYEEGAAFLAERILRSLGYQYADHPHYRHEWAP
ncbi:DUF6221 family protein [Geodermatophilus sp. SYSU D00696]